MLIKLWMLLILKEKLLTNYLEMFVHFTKEHTLKDLEKLGRNLSNIIIIDVYFLHKYRHIHIHIQRIHQIHIDFMFQTL